MDGLAERRSIAYHREIADRLMRDPGLVELARARVREWQRSETHPSWIAAWSELLAQPLDELCRALVQDTERMTSLRQMTPFAGVLDARTRWALWSGVR